MKTPRIALAAALLATVAGLGRAHEGPEEHGTPDASRKVSNEVSKKVGEGAIILAKAHDLDRRVVVIVDSMPALTKEEPAVVLDPMPRYKPDEPAVVRPPSPRMEEAHKARELAATVGEAKTTSAHVGAKPDADLSGGQSDRLRRQVANHGKPLAPAPGELSKTHEVNLERVFNSGLNAMGVGTGVGGQLRLENVGGSQHVLHGQESFLRESVGEQGPVGTDIYKVPEPKQPRKP